MADTLNNRVLRYPSVAGTISTTADQVWGQPDFASNTPNNGGRNANSLVNPNSVVLDMANNLYVADTGNSRILRFPNVAGTISTTADRVWGQADFASLSFSVNATTLLQPLRPAVGRPRQPPTGSAAVRHAEVARGSWQAAGGGRDGSGAKALSELAPAPIES